MRRSRVCRFIGDKDNLLGLCCGGEKCDGGFFNDIATRAGQGEKSELVKRRHARAVSGE